MAPRYIRQSLFDSTAPVLGVTTNSCLDASHKLVMGAGAALDLAKQYPKIPYAAGRYIHNTCGNLGRYGWFTIGQVDHQGRFGRRFGCFQTKIDWRHPSRLDLIAYSIEKLNESMARSNDEVAINFPGIGRGGLRIEDVFELTERLNDRVTIYYNESIYDHWLSAMSQRIAA